MPLSLPPLYLLTMISTIRPFVADFLSSSSLIQRFQKHSVTLLYVLFACNLYMFLFLSTLSLYPGFPSSNLENKNKESRKDILLPTDTLQHSSVKSEFFFEMPHMIIGLDVGSFAWLGLGWVGLTEQTLFKKYIYNIQINWSAFHIAVFMSFKKFVCVLQHALYV